MSIKIFIFILTTILLIIKVFEITAITWLVVLFPISIYCFLMFLGLIALYIIDRSNSEFSKEIKKYFLEQLKKK